MPGRASGDELDPDPELVLLVETGAGLIARRIPTALPLRQDEAQGLAAESATREAAAIWGLPDFVYRSAVRRVGSGVREVGDSIIIVGALAIVVQVKSRESPSVDPAKETRWIHKNAAKALRQAAGTVRLLCQEPATLTNFRDRAITIDGTALDWVAAVVIDHTAVPDDLVVSLDTTPIPSVVLTRRDWEFLFAQLKSTHAVAAYLRRVSGKEHELNTEPMRYYDLAQADHEAVPGPLHPALERMGGARSSVPLLPYEPAATSDLDAHLLFRTIFEDIATGPGTMPDETARLRMLSEIDRLPVGHRGQLGQFVLEGLDALANEPEGSTAWLSRRVAGGPGGLHLAFAACSSEATEFIRAAFSTWVQIRHHQYAEQIGGANGLMTVGVMITPRQDGQRPWDTTVFAIPGDLDLTDDEIALYTKLWPAGGTDVIEQPSRKAS